MNDSKFIPVLRVRDARKSAKFYGDYFGFIADWEHQFQADFPLFMSVSLGSLQLFLSEHEGSGMNNAELYVYVPNLNSLYTQLSSKEVSIEQPPTIQPWGVKDMKMLDPDQHRFIFAEKLEYSYTHTIL